MTQPLSPPPSRGRFSGLDGLRALAVVLVVVYHLFPGWLLRSGFVGVDVFFVISGFLITSLLLRERAATGGIDLMHFWRRRARRLLPALGAVVTVAATWAWAVGGDVLVHVGRQVVAAATFSYNWVSVGSGSDYFSADTPELFRNLWSLAVEEQFYWAWPLLLPLLLAVRWRWLRAGVALAAAAASAVWMAELVTSGVTRAYFGTDSHAFGLLIGVALAVGLDRPARTARHRAPGAIVGGAALIGLATVAMLPETSDAATFPGTLLAASLLSAIVIVAATAPGSWLGAALDCAPLRWIGDRSYGIYLWHWPLLVLVTATAGLGTGETPIWVGVLTLILTGSFAAVSYRWIEQPVRRRGFRATFGMLRARLAAAPAPRFRALTALVLGAVVIGGTTAAIATAPAETAGQSAVEAGRAALQHTAAAVRPPLVDDRPTPRRSVAPTPVEGRDIDAIGDSVMLASAPALLDRYPDIRIDAEVSRSMWAAPRLVDDLARRDELRPYVVLGLGTNGAVDTALLDDVVRRLGPERRLVLVTAYAPRSWIADVNKRLRAYTADHPDVILADWAGAISGHRELLAGDGIHPGEAGGRYYATAIADAIAADQRARAHSHARMLLRTEDLAAAHPDRAS